MFNKFKIPTTLLQNILHELTSMYYYNLSRYNYACIKFYYVFFIVLYLQIPELKLWKIKQIIYMWRDLKTNLVGNIETHETDLFLIGQLS